MTKTIKLPTHHRACPKCGASMKAIRATRGGGWSGTGLRFLYCCEACDHEALLETVQSRSMTYLASGLLILAGLIMLFASTFSGGAILGLLSLLLGSVSLWLNGKTSRAYQRVAGKTSPPMQTKIEEDIFLTEAEKNRHHLMQRYGSILIYGMALLVLFMVISDWMAQ
ncbi:MAG: hypothetical protein N4A65_03895 [Cohaesibacter sp.]|nr:hypothetical protein [Cohaesibacter sp.]